MHDLASEHYPEAYTPGDLKMQRYALRRCVPRADRVIAVSQSVREDLLRFSRVREDRIEIIHEAADERFFQAPADSQPPLGLEPGYVLFVGNVVPRKNLGTLIDAYAEARTRGVSGALVIARPAHVFLSRIRLFAFFDQMLKVGRNGQSLGHRGLLSNGSSPRGSAGLCLFQKVLYRVDRRHSCS